MSKTVDVNTAKLLAFQKEQEKAIDSYNKALVKGNLEKMQEAENLMREAEKSYRAKREKMWYDEFAQDENPMLTAVTKRNFTTIAHRTIREDGEVVAIEATEKVCEVDLIKFCNRAKINSDWRHSVQKLNLLAALRVANELKIPKKEVQEMNDCWAMSQIARDIDMGKTPESNTQMKKLLQEVVDKILFVDDGKGKNVYKVNNHDIAYITYLYCGRGRSALTVRAAKNNYFTKLITDVLHRLAIDGVYSIDYKKITKKEEAPEKQNATKTTETKTAKKSTKKAA